MKVYGITITGEVTVGYKHSIMSKNLFRTKQAAVEGASDFAERCCDPVQLNHFEHVTEEMVQYPEYELED